MKINGIKSSVRLPGGGSGKTCAAWPGWARKCWGSHMGEPGELSEEARTANDWAGGRGVLANSYSMVAQTRRERGLSRQLDEAWCAEPWDGRRPLGTLTSLWG